MTEKQMSRYLRLLDERGTIMGHSGYDWRPEYSQELKKIENELAALRVTADGESGESAGYVANTPSEMPTMVPLTKEAKETGLSYGFLRGLVADNKISYVMAGKKVLINHESLMRYLEKGEVNV